MWPDRVSNPGPLTYESGALPTALRGPALSCESAEMLLQFEVKSKQDLFRTFKLEESCRKGISETINISAKYTS